MGVIFGIAVLLTVIAVIGHGIWISVAALARYIFSGSSPRTSAPPFCPVCGISLNSDVHQCSQCHWQVSRSAKNAAHISLEHLTSLQRRGKLKVTTYQEIRDTLLQEIEPRALPPLPSLPSLPRDTAVPSIPLSQDPLFTADPASLSPPTSGAVLPIATAPANVEAARGESFTDPTVSDSVADSPFESQLPGSPSTLDVHERARRFQARMATAELASDAVSHESLSVGPPAVPKVARKNWGELFASFMEEKHIRWGELVGGLLIVSCSIALVLSFWSQIAERPLLKFGVLNGVTAALFGLGLHAGRRWKLPTTSEGILIIATMLVPLNFLAIAAFTDGSGPANWVAIGGELLSIAIFTWLLYLASSRIQSLWPWATTAAVMIPSVLQLLTRRWIDSESSTTVLYLMALSSLLVYAGSNAFSLTRLRKLPTWLAEHNADVFKMLGLSSFALLLPLALLLFKSGSVLPTLRLLAPLASFVAMPMMGAGLLTWRRSEQRLGGWQTVGAAITALSGLVLIAGIALSWPQAMPLIASSTMAAALLMYLGVRLRIPEAHGVAAIGLLLSYLLAVQVITHRLPLWDSVAAKTFAALTSPSSGHALSGGVAIFFGLAMLFRQRQAQLESRIYLGFSGLCAVVGLGLLTWHGFGLPNDPYRLTWVYAVYSLLVTGAGLRGLIPGKPYAGLILHPLLLVGGALTLAALSQGIVYVVAERVQWTSPWLTVFLIQATGFTSIALLCQTQKVQGMLSTRLQQSNPQDSWFVWGLVGTFATVAVLLRQGLFLHQVPSAGTILWLALIWRGLSAIKRSPVYFWLFQSCLALSVTLFVDQHLRQREWYVSAEDGWLHPYSIQAYGCALAALSLVWSGVRQFSDHWSNSRQTERDIGERLNTAMYTSFPCVDYAVTGLLLAVLAGLAITSAVPGLGQELSPRSIKTIREIIPTVEFELWGTSHSLAMGIGSWTLAGMLTAVLLAGIRERYQTWKLAGLALIAASICLLIAARFEGQVAVASALRWVSSIVFVLGSIAVWSYSSLASRISWLSHRREFGAGNQLTRDILAALLFVAVAPLSGMACFLAIAALDLRPPSATELQTMIILGVIAGVVVLAWFTTSFNREGTESMQMLGDEKNGLQRSSRTNRNNAWAQTTNAFLILGIAPLVAMTVYVVAASLTAHPITGPDPESFFSQIGLATSYGLPLILISAALVGHSIFQHSPRLALVSGLMVNACAMTLYLLSGVGPLNALVWLRLAQLNAGVAAAFAICWMAYLAWRSKLSPRDAALHVKPSRFIHLSPLVTHVVVAIGFLILFVLPATATLFLYPRTPWGLEQAAGLWGWGSFALTFVAMGILLGKQRLGNLLSWGALILACLIALQSFRWDLGNGLAYHVLQAELATIGLLIALWMATPRRASWQINHSVGNICFVLTLLMAVCAIGLDSQAPFWPCLGFLSGAAMMVLRAVASGSRRYVYLAAGLINIAASVWWLSSGILATLGLKGSDPFADFLLVNIIAFALPAAVWRWLDMRWIAPQHRVPFAVGCHRIVAGLGLLGYCGFIAISLYGDIQAHPGHASNWLLWPALISVAIAVAVCLWDPESRWAVLGLYVAGLAGIATFVDVMNLPPKLLLWVATVALAAYGLLTSYFWSRRVGLTRAAESIGIPLRNAGPDASHHWLTPANVLISLAVVTLGFAAQMAFEQSTARITTAQSIFVQALSMGLLARGKRESLLRIAALGLAVLGAVAFSWSFLVPGTPGIVVNRLVATSAALGCMTMLYGIGLSKILKRENDWTRSAARFTPVLAAAALAVIAIELVTEVFAYATRGSVDLGGPGIAVVAVTLLGLAVAALMAAIIPGRDPLGLSESQRQFYVYGAEGLLALLFLHIRLTMPYLFTGAFQRYWPLIVMAIAFIGVGLSEIFRRKEQKVLAVPLERTGVLLPMLPVLGFWIAPAQVHYSLLMLIVGVMYGALSAMRRSFGFGIVAALAVNGGLWFLLHEAEGLGLWEHPQLWLIPPALCALVASHLNRARLSSSQMTSIRYLTSTVIYTASTADIFLNGVAQAPWLPVILAGLSILGIAAGIFLRVRAFLFLGTSFLGLAMLTVIWHAAVDLHQTWLWFVTGIVAGAVIIAIFALFEKKRQEILYVMDRLKQWQP